MEARKHERRAAEGDREPRQIKTRERVRHLAEVYTHQREVEGMLELVGDMFPNEDDPDNTDRAFLEPACGSGNFLVQILSRKLRYVTPRRHGRGERFEHWILRCLASIYGLDISPDNVGEARGRMRTVIDAHLMAHAYLSDVTPSFDEAVEAILETNIVRADTLADATEVELIEYRPGSAGTFIREWSRPLAPGATELSLFSLAPRCDEIPVHYSELARQTEPVLIDSCDREVA